MKFELDYDFMTASRIPFDGDDLRLGVSLGLISPTTAIALARDIVGRGTTDPSVVGAAELKPDDIAGVRVALRAVDPEDADLYPPISVRRWVFLELKAAYEVRDRLNDPLGVVEQIYADFDYPSSVAAFVRYMPPPRDAPTGEEALLGRWAQFLADEATVLADDKPQV